MKTILDKIVANRRIEVEQQKKKISLEELEKQIDFSVKVNSLSRALRREGASGIIAEFKRQSPSKGVINDSVFPDIVTSGYRDAGVSGISVLTEEKYFGGGVNDLKKARAAVPGVPILRKDFTIDPFQIIEARTIGADAILLIAAVLSKKEIKELTSVAHRVGLEVLLELHDEAEIEKIDPEVDIIGINNRNLKDFTVDIDRSIRLFEKLPAGMLKIAESGISDPATVDLLRSNGFKGFLMGENFMKEKNPGEACKEFISELKID
jgi:indole-3-glycerol phosphate synthase